MRGVCLLGVLLVARAAVLAGRDLPVSLWSPIALFWQDLLAAAGFALVDAALGRKWLAWPLYAAAVAYVALNVAVARVLSTPLTPALLRATRGAIADSIRYYANAQHLAAPALVAATGLVLPLLLRRRALRPGHVPAFVALCAIALGPFAASRIETAGLERNAIVALAASALPRVAARALPEEDWRASPVERPTPADLARLRGAARGRSVILVMLESAGAGYLAPWGAREDPAPVLTGLARRALTVENAYAVYPESIKGLFSVLCSAYPGFDTDPEIYRGARSPSIAGVLRASGYRTGLFHSGRFMYLGMDGIVSNRGFDTVEDAGDIGGNRNSSFGIDEASTVRRILAWLDGLARDERFFVVYLPVAGHHPYATAGPGPFPATREIDRYRNALHEGDRALGDLVDGLRARGLERKALLVAAGDHGEAFGQHAGNYGHTLSIYEENVRVPFLIAAPGLIEDAVRVGGVASLIDAAPTILDLLGYAAPPDFQGRSLLAAPPAMALFYTDYSLGLLGLRDGCRKYIFEIESRRSRLFDLCRDPAETVDLARAAPGLTELYRNRLERWAAAQRERCLQAPNRRLR